MMVFVLAFWMVATLIPTSAFADGFRIRIEDMSVATAPDGYGVVILDDGDGDFAAGQPGAITVVLDPSFGTNPLSDNVTTNLTLAFSKPMYPQTTDFLAELKLQSLQVTATGATTVRLTLEDTGYISQAGVLQLQTSLTNLALASGATITSQSWASALPPDLGTLQSSPTNLSALADLTGAGTFLNTSGDSFALFETTGATYALYTQIVITFGADGGTVAFDQDNTVTKSDQLPEGTPEPGSLLLIATGVIGAGSRMRRKLFTRG
jgi:PEP-CTERM putative exosortase interaction domain